MKKEQAKSDLPDFKPQKKKRVRNKRIKRKQLIKFFVKLFGL